MPEYYFYIIGCPRCQRLMLVLYIRKNKPVVLQSLIPANLLIIIHSGWLDKNIHIVASGWSLPLDCLQCECHFRRSK